MPSTTRRQQKFFFAELGRKRRGQKTRTGLSEGKIREFTKLKKDGAFFGHMSMTTSNPIKAVHQ